MRTGWLTVRPRLRRRSLRGGAAIALLGVLAVVASACSSGGTSSYIVKADFSNGIDLYPSSPVTMLGVNVGTVSSVQNQADHVLVTMRVNDTYRIPAGANAAVVGQSLLGERYVQFSPSYTGGPQLTDGSLIPLSRTTVPVSADEVLAGLKKFLGAINPNGAADLTTNLAQVLGGNGARLNDLIHNAAGTLQLLADKGNDLGQLNGSLAQLTGALDTRTQTITQLIQDYNTVSAVLIQNGGQTLGDTITQLNNASAQVADLLSPNLAGLHDDIGVLTTAARTLDRNLSSLDQANAASVNLFAAAQRAYDPQANWLRLNAQSDPNTTSSLIESRIRDRLSGVCRRLEAKGIRSATLDNCSQVGTHYFDPILNAVPCILNQQSGPGCSPAALFGAGVNAIPGLTPGQRAQTSQGPAPSAASPAPGASSAPPASPSLTVPPLLPPMPNRQSAPGSSGGLLGGL
ncbi:MAG TPA: MCE family protein [Acidimicrobiales bacterium]|jgi:phospholipid/cholesterol/gamma-HCH transport system substrate-binding protein